MLQTYFQFILLILKRVLNFLLIIGMFSLTINVLWGVISRYGMGQQSTFTEPLAKSLLVWVTMLGGAVAYSDRAHLGVDYFVDLLHVDTRRITRVLIPVMVIMFAGLVMGIGGYQLTANRLHSGQTIPGLWGIERGYIYLSVPVSGFFICLFALEQLVASLRNPNDQSSESSSER